MQDQSPFVLTGACARELAPPGAANHGTDCNGCGGPGLCQTDRIAAADHAALHD
jgi:hypothetical protein